MRGKFGVGLAGSALVAGALALVVGIGGSPQDDGAEAVVAEPGPPPVVQQDPGGTTEGIKVHGHWIIEIRDPDGSLVSRREFDNSLTPNGKQLLREVLGRVRSFGGWSIRMGGATGAHPCAFGGSPRPCLIVESDVCISPCSSEVFPNLTVSVNSGGIVLAGSATAAGDGSIGFVQAYLESCNGVISATECSASGSSPGTQFTSQTITAEVVQTGQSITVSVLLGFS